MTYHAHDERILALIGNALPGARVLGVTALGADSVEHATTLKGAGYGSPLRIELEVDGAKKSVVLHTATSNAFGHDRRSDRAADALLLSDDSGAIARHVRVLDVGAFRGDSDVVSLRDTGDFYVLTEWGDGAPYANDLRRIAESGVATEGDVGRAARLAEYLAELHAERPAAPYAYQRALRDLLGSGEGIFGISDSYPVEGFAARLQRIEGSCLEWRWRLKRIARPLARTHGDFHPFNVLFDGRGELVLLDTSRGSCGDPADDVTCMAINYVFFAVERPALWVSAFSRLWSTFWQTYLQRSKDSGVLDVAAPFLAWRGLVLASPVWYPELSSRSRESLLDFVEMALHEPRFEPSTAGRVFA